MKNKNFQLLQIEAIDSYLNGKGNMTGRYLFRSGLDIDLALKFVVQLTSHDALQVHARYELGINQMTWTKPLQAAIASFASLPYESCSQLASLSLRR